MPALTTSVDVWLPPNPSLVTAGNGVSTLQPMDAQQVHRLGELGIDTLNSSDAFLAPHNSSRSSLLEMELVTEEECIEKLQRFCAGKISIPWSLTKRVPLLVASDAFAKMVTDLRQALRPGGSSAKEKWFVLLGGAFSGATTLGRQIAQELASTVPVFWMRTYSTMDLVNVFRAVAAAASVSRNRPCLLVIDGDGQRNAATIGFPGLVVLRVAHVAPAATRETRWAQRTAESETLLAQVSTVLPPNVRHELVSFYRRLFPAMRSEDVAAARALEHLVTLAVVAVNQPRHPSLARYIAATVTTSPSAAVVRALCMLCLVRLVSDADGAVNLLDLTSSPPFGERPVVREPELRALVDAGLLRALDTLPAALAVTCPLLATAVLSFVCSGELYPLAFKDDRGAAGPFMTVDDPGTPTLPALATWLEHWEQQRLAAATAGAGNSAADADALFAPILATFFVAVACELYDCLLGRAQRMSPRDREVSLLRRFFYAAPGEQDSQQLPYLYRLPWKAAGVTFSDGGS